jgi:glycine dehydrogenase subunit 1
MAVFTPHNSLEIRKMLEVCGAASIEQLFSNIPADCVPKSFDIPDGCDEMAALSALKHLSSKNKIGDIIFAGGGYYDHYIPAAVDALASRSEFSTAYTPYQPEASQGTLQAIFEYQTMIARLSGMDVSNASLYDGGTALYEAIAMAVKTNARKKILVCRGVNPLFRDIVRTYLNGSHMEMVEVDLRNYHTDVEAVESLFDDTVSALVLQSPNFFGMIEDHAGLFQKAKAKGITAIDVFNPLCAGVLQSPGERGADIAVAEGQSLGMPLSFGGPYLGILAASKSYLRKMPGRIAGRTIDKNGKICYVLTLQAREQHIRREKATSNICSNQSLCALRASIFLALVGSEGIKRIGEALASKGALLKKYLPESVKLIKGISLHEFTLELPVHADEFIKQMSALGFNAGIPASLFYPEKKNILITAVTEKRTAVEIVALTSAMCDVLERMERSAE